MGNKAKRRANKAKRRAKRKAKKIARKQAGKKVINLKKAAEKVGGATKKVTISVGNAANKAGKGIAKAANKVGAGVKNVAEDVGDGLGDAAQAVGGGAKKLGKGIGKGANAVGGFVTNVAEDVADAAGDFIGELDVSISPLTGLTLSNQGEGEYRIINKGLMSIPFFANLFKKDQEKWRKLLCEKYRPNSKIDGKKNFYYINGLATDLDKGKANAEYIRNYFDIKGDDLKLIFNPTLGVGWKETGIIADIKEAKRDYDWFLSTKEGKNIKDFDVNWLLGNPIGIFVRLPITNPVTIGVIALLCEGKAQGAPINLITSSQGSLIVFNALIAFIKLDSSNAEYLKGKVKLCNIGCVVPKKRYRFMDELLSKHCSHVHFHDPVAKFLGLRFNFKDIIDLIFPLSEAFPKFHEVNWYLPHKDNFKKRDNFHEVKEYYKDVAAISRTKAYNMKDGDLIRVEPFVDYTFFD